MFGLEDELRERIAELEAQPKIGLCRDCWWWERRQVMIDEQPPYRRGHCENEEFPGNIGISETWEDFGCTLHKPKQQPPSPTDPKPILE